MIFAIVISNDIIRIHEGEKKYRNPDKENIGHVLSFKYS